MNRAITIGIPHEEGKAPIIVTGPGVPFSDQRAKFREILASKEHPYFRQVELWTSGHGLVKKKKFLQPEPPAKSKAKPKGAQPDEKDSRKADEKKADPTPETSNKPS